jgi:hypothetical protein
MPITRRHFLRAGGVAVVAAGTHGGFNALASERQHAPESLAGQPGATTSAFMSKADFAAHLRTVFVVRPGERQEVRLELVEVSDSGPEQSRAAGRECFSLAFRARDPRALKQSTYQMEHRALGRFDLFVVPVKSEKHGQVFQAIVNHARA